MDEGFTDKGSRKKIQRKERFRKAEEMYKNEHHHSINLRLPNDPGLDSGINNA